MYSRRLAKSRETVKVQDVHQVEHEKVQRKLRDRVNELDEENRHLARKVCWVGGWESVVFYKHG